MAANRQRTNGCCGALDFASFAPFSGANSSPKKRPIARFQGLGCYQTRSGFRPAARLLAFGIRHSAFGFGLWLSAARRFALRVAFTAGGRPRTCSQRLRRFGFHVFRSFFRSEFEAPKTPLSHGLTGLGAIKAGADSGAEKRLRQAGGGGLFADAKAREDDAQQVVGREFAGDFA